jgi:hypothetical protein
MPQHVRMYRELHLGPSPDPTEQRMEGGVIGPSRSDIKWKHHKRYQRLCNQVQALETQANRTRFRKKIDIRTFAYHVG